MKNEEGYFIEEIALGVPFVNFIEIHTEDPVSFQLPLKDATIKFSLPKMKKIVRNLDI